MQQTNWLIKITDGEHFSNSINQQVWAIETVNSKNGLKNQNYKRMLPGDRLWFALNSNNGGRIKYVASFVSWKKRELGPLIEIDQNNNERGWNKTQPSGTNNWDVDIFYENLYHIEEIGIKPIYGSGALFTCANVVSLESKHTVEDLNKEYKNIVKYSKCFKL